MNPHNHEPFGRQRLYDTADFILKWLEERNAGELKEALENQKTGDRRLMREELVEILRFMGKPPNWTTP